MSTLVNLIDWAGKGLTLLVLLLAVLFIVWQCFEGVMRMTTIGAEFHHFIRNRRAFDRWNKELDEREERERQESLQALSQGQPCKHQPATTSSQALGLG